VTSVLSLTSAESLCLQQISTGTHTSKVNCKLGVGGRGERREKDALLPMTEERRVALVLYSLAGDLSEATELLPFP